AMLHTGSSGHDVRVLQSWLDKLGFSTDVDGQFGRHTRWSLRRYEQANELPVNGILEPRDAQVMRSQMQSRYPASSQTTTQTAPGDLESWGSRGRGSWITVYANSGHAYVIIAGLRFDTSGDANGSGPRWHTDLRSGSGYVARHPSGL